jgi:hypothetical protein
MVIHVFRVICGMATKIEMLKKCISLKPCTKSFLKQNLAGMLLRWPSTKYAFNVAFGNSRWPPLKIIFPIWLID